MLFLKSQIKIDMNVLIIVSILFILQIFITVEL